MQNPASSGLNVVGLLAHMYHSGDDQMPSPAATNALDERTIHTLYAISFIIYSLNVGCDWVHTLYACQGDTMTFEMESWLVITMVSCCIIGTVLTLLLMVLCIEHAFTNRLPLDPYQGGFSLIMEYFGDWIMSFNCFRISFLVLIFQDAPITFVNFWFLSSCRIPGPVLSFWPLTLSTLSTVISLAWKLIMLYYAYRHFWFFQLNKVQLNQINRESSTVDELRSKVDVENRERMYEFDECWPVRYSYQQTYGTTASRSGSQDIHDLSQSPSGQSIKFPQVKCLIGRGVKACVCCCMCSMLYSAMCITGCIPCCYHYTCTNHAAQHRHKFAKTCTRVCSTGYNMFILLFSAILALTLFIVNCLWITSVHVVGQNGIPPEIKKLCLEIDSSAKTVKPSLLPSGVYASNVSHYVTCKPIFESYGWGFGFQREKPVPWTKRKTFGAETLTMWADVIMDYARKNQPAIMFDFRVETTNNFKTICKKWTKSDWTVPRSIDYLPWPYYRACKKSYDIVTVNVLMCNGTRNENNSNHNNNNH